MDTKLDRVLHDLRILAKIPRNGRIKKSDMGRVTIEENNYLVSVRRYYNQDSRKQAMQDIAAIFNDAFAEVNSILTSRYFTVPVAPQTTQFTIPAPMTIPVPPSTRVTTRASSPSLDPFHHQYTTQHTTPPMSNNTHMDDERIKILNTLAILCRDLTLAIEGVMMLKLTYSQDIAMITALDRLIEKVTLCIKDIRKKVPEEVLAEFCPEPPKQEFIVKNNGSTGGLSTSL